MDAAGEKLGDAIDDVAHRWRPTRASWLNRRARRKISWLKLITSGALVLALAIGSPLLRCAIERRLDARLRGEPQSASQVVLDAIRHPLYLFMWMCGVSWALTPLFPSFRWGREARICFAASPADSPKPSLSSRERGLPCVSSSSSTAGSARGPRPMPKAPRKSSRRSPQEPAPHPARARVVVVEGEWGRIQKISLTCVVVRIWDQRRLVLPQEAGARPAADTRCSITPGIVA